MREQYHFKQTANPEINAAMVGVSKWNWRCVEANDPLEQAWEIMTTNDFDVLPIKEQDGSYSSFYITKQWGEYDFDNIEIRTLAVDFRLYYLTTIHDTILKFASSGSKYYFLDNQRDVVGLITIGNINSKYVYLYLYNLIIQLEQGLGHFIYRTGISDDILVSLFRTRQESDNAKSALERYFEDNERGYDYNFIEYIYLTDLAYIIVKKGLCQKLTITEVEFKSLISKINNVRNVVAHPNRSIIKDESSIVRLAEAIQGIDILLLKLAKQEH